MSISTSDLLPTFAREQARMQPNPNRIRFLSGATMQNYGGKSWVCQAGTGRRSEADQRPHGIR